MAAINPSTLHHYHCSSSSSSSTLRSFSTYSIPKSTPHLTFNYQFNRSAAFPLVLSRPINNNSNTKRLRAFAIVSAFKKLSKTEAIAVPEESDEITEKFPSDSGVYAVYDKNNDLQFIGMTRSIATSVRYHRKTVPDLCSSVKLALVDQTKGKALPSAWLSWMDEYMEATGKIPPGNELENDTWVVKKLPLKKSDLRLTPGRDVQLTVPLEDLIDQLVKENKVVAFIKGSRNAPAGGLSQRVVGILDGTGVDYESVDVLDDNYNSGLRETLKIYSNCPIIPQIFVNGELLGGCDILTSMQEKGELASLLKK